MSVRAAAPRHLPLLTESLPQFNQVKAHQVVGGDGWALTFRTHNHLSQRGDHDPLEMGMLASRSHVPLDGAVKAGVLNSHFLAD